MIWHTIPKHKHNIPTKDLKTHYLNIFTSNKSRQKTKERKQKITQIATFYEQSSSFMSTLIHVSS